METTTLTSGNLNGDMDGLPNREVVRQAQKNLSMNAKFWTLIKNGRIPYKIVDGKLVEASYVECIKGLKNPPTMEIYWLTDGEYRLVDYPAYGGLSEALKRAQEGKDKLNLFKED